MADSPARSHQARREVSSELASSSTQPAAATELTQTQGGRAAMEDTPLQKSHAPPARSTGMQRKEVIRAGSSALAGGPQHAFADNVNERRKPQTAEPLTEGMALAVPQTSSARGQGTMTKGSASASTRLRTPSEERVGDHQSMQERQFSRSRSRPRRQLVKEGHTTSAASVPLLPPQDPPARTQGGASATSSDARPIRGGRVAAQEADLLPGQIHGSRVVYETQRYIFCAICGTYGRYLKRTRLHAVCPRKSRTRWAQIAIDDLMQGDEPGGVKTNTPAVPYLAD